jgi:single-stranded DNA-binding protein
MSKPTVSKPTVSKPGVSKPGVSKTTVSNVTGIEPVNLSVVCGDCSAAPEVRVLESGTRLATLALRCPSGDERATSVPVTVWDPPAWLETVAPGDRVVVVGRLRRRFFQRPGGVGSRVDLEADVIARAGDRRRGAAALRRAQRALEPLEDAVPRERRTE